ncbi:conserved hypothetical protein, partial [Listeria marthii FSL S4-120]
NSTKSIISPPNSVGSIASSNSRLPYKAPMPVGAIILCPEKV